ncbi:hypothetical protein FQZ97_790720 [compost metagenome]
MQAQAVKQLGLISGQAAGQALDLDVVRVFQPIGRRATRHSLEHRHALQHAGHVFQRGRGIQTVEAQRIDGVDHRGAVGPRQRVDQAQHIRTVHRAQHLAHRDLLQLATAKGDRLVGERKRVAHGAARGPRDEAQGLGFGGHLLGLQHLHQVLLHRLGRHGSQVELQTARQHRDRHLLRVGRGQHELEVLGRLFQRLQHGVERRVGQHVNLVDHEDLEAALHRLVDRLFQQRLHLVHAPVGRGIEFGVVHETAGVDVGAGLAHTAGFGGDATLPVGAQAVERLGQDARDGGLAHAARAGEQVGVVQPLGGQCVGQRPDHVLLPHHFGEIARAVLAGQNDIGHGRDSKRRPWSAKGGRHRLQSTPTGLPAW